MANHSTLTSLFSDTADAIRLQAGTADSIVADDFPDAIANINKVGDLPKDIIFIDYDGRVIEEYDLADYLALDPATDQGYSTYYVPEAPSHDGLTFEGWNFPSDSDIAAYVNGIGCAVIGALYHTTDATTKLYLNIEDTDELSLRLAYFHVSSTITSTIDWGDGTTTSVASGADGKINTHTYSALGEYVITISSSNTTGTNLIRLGYDTTNTLLAADNGYSSGNHLCSPKCLYKVETAKWVGSLYGFCFFGARNLRSVSVSGSMTGSSCFPAAVATNVFFGCENLTGFVYPKISTLYIGTSTFFGAKSLKYVSVPYSSTLNSSGTFSGSGVLCVYMYAATYSTVGFIAYASTRKIVVGAANASSSLASMPYMANLDTVDASNLTVSTIPATFANTCGTLKTFAPPKGITTIAASAFLNCYLLQELDFSDSDITSIATNAFNSCRSCLTYNFTGCTTVPTLGAVNSFNGINPNAKIIVPDSLLSSWKTASNWSTYASYIYGESEV